MKHTNIEWATHTFNIIRGCEKISPGCANCYADTLAKRNPKILGEWGKNAPRIYAAEAYRQQPLIWNRQASPNRPRVFCPSLGDIFEDYQGGRVLDTSGNLIYSNYTPVLLELITTIRLTPNLDWLLLTKRPHNIIPALEKARKLGQNNPSPLIRETSRMIERWIHGNDPPENVWLGTSVESQSYLHRAHHLIDTPAKLHFLSCEPLLGPLKFSESLLLELDWIIVGGESGARARPMKEDWPRQIRDQCHDYGIPFFFKQWGSHHPDGSKASKKSTGHELDGETHLSFPASAPL